MSVVCLYVVALMDNFNWVIARRNTVHIRTNANAPAATRGAKWRWATAIPFQIDCNNHKRCRAEEPAARDGPVDLWYLLNAATDDVWRPTNPSWAHAPTALRWSTEISTLVAAAAFSCTTMLHAHSLRAWFTAFDADDAVCRWCCSIFSTLNSRCIFVLTMLFVCGTIGPDTCGSLIDLLLVWRTLLRTQHASQYRATSWLVYNYRGMIVIMYICWVIYCGSRAHLIRCLIESFRSGERERFFSRNVEQRRFVFVIGCSCIFMLRNEHEFASMWGWAARVEWERQLICTHKLNTGYISAMIWHHATLVLVGFISQ